MKAAVYDVAGGPDVLRYVDVLDPVCAGDGLVIQVEAVSVDSGDALTGPQLRGGPCDGFPGRLRQGSGQSARSA